MQALNIVSNIAFVIGAIYAFHIWYQHQSKDYFSLVLISLVALIGIGSFIFHAFPSDVTIWIDLIPIQIFVLSYFAYIGAKYFKASTLIIILSLVLFFFARQYWIAYMPSGALGGGITHIPTLLLLTSCGLLLLSRYKDFSIKLLSAAFIYMVALFVRAWDKEISLEFWIGVYWHWAWHILTAITASILISAIVNHPANKYGSATKMPNTRPEVVRQGKTD